LREWNDSLRSRRAEKALEYRFRSPSMGLGGVSSSMGVKAAGMKLSFRELGLPTPEALRVEPGRGDGGMSEGEDDREGDLKG
jgi:hypothetical protein